jgi:hypothetical protein
VILERFASIYKYNRDFIVVLPSEIWIRIDVELIPREAALAGKLDQAFLDDFAEVTAFTGVKGDLAVIHGRIVYQQCKCRGWDR